MISFDYTYRFAEAGSWTYADSVRCSVDVWTPLISLFYLYRQESQSQLALSEVEFVSAAEPRENP